MRKKYHTLEELRAANREKQRKWREGHSWEEKQRVARAYGTRTVKVKVEGYGVVDLPEWVLALSNQQLTDKNDKGRDGIRTSEAVSRDADRGAVDQEAAGVSAARVRWGEAEDVRARQSDGDEGSGGFREERGSAEVARVIDWIERKQAERSEKKVVTAKGGRGVEIELEGI